jgi:hypothetical protein
MTFDEINALGQIIDTTWGKSSDTGMAGHSCKVAYAGNNLTITYNAICTFASDQAMREQSKSYEKDADQIIAKLAVKIKSDFKTKAGRVLKMKEGISNGSFEIIGVQSHISPKRTALYRRQCHYTVE